MYSGFKFSFLRKKDLIFHDKYGMEFVGKIKEIRTPVFFIVSIYFVKTFSFTPEIKNYDMKWQVQIHVSVVYANCSNPLASIFCSFHQCVKKINK